MGLSSRYPDVSRALLVAGALACAAAPARADVYDKLAKGLLKGVSDLGKAKAAVLPFAYADGRSSPGGRIVAEGLSNAIADRSKDALVERDQIDKAMQEMQLAATGAISSGTAVQAGRLAGAKYLVVGTLEEISDTAVEVRARLIEAESGVVRAQAKGEVKRTWRDVEILANGPKPLSVTEVSMRQPEILEPLIQRFGDRTVRIEYSNTQDRPVIRMTDVTDPKRPDAADVEVPYDTRRNKFADMEGRRVKVGGRRYLVWTGVFSPERGPIVHIAPLKGFFSNGTIGDQEIIIEWMNLVERWVKDLQRRGSYLGVRGGLELIAFFERLVDKRLRASVWEIETSSRRVANFPREHLELQGRRGGSQASNVVAIGGRHFRFRWDCDSDRVLVEEL